jgi:predicted Zn-dependent peptidase
MADPIVTTLRCGMPLIAQPIPGMKSVGLTWLVSGGSAREPENLQGLGAMWSELVFRGAGELDSRAHADALDTLGVGRSSSVGAHHLRLAFSMLGDTLHDALALITPMVRAPRFDESSIDPVRELCVAAIETLADEPQERAMLGLRAHHNAAPFNRSGMGTIEGLRRITRFEVAEEWSRLARPGGSILAVAGDVDPERVESRLNELLEGWEGEAPPIEASGSADRGYHHETDETNQVHIAVAHDAPPESTDDALLEKAVIAALSGGMSGRLFTEVREKRALVYAVYARYRSDRDFARVSAYAGTTPERAQETLDVLLHELGRLNETAERGGGIDKSEFDRAIVGMKSRVVMSGESTGARAGALAGDYHLLGRPRTLEEITEAIDALTLERVNAYLARRRLGEMTVVTIGPAALTMPEGASRVA